MSLSRRYFGLIGTSLVSAFLVSCKPGADNSRLKTLDNFAAGKRLTVNQCRATDEIVNHEASKMLFADLASRVIWETKKTDAEKTEMLRSMELAFAALPLEVREFSLRLGLKIYVTEGANTQCTSDDIARIGKNMGKLSSGQIDALKEDLSQVDTCYLWLPPEQRVKNFGIGDGNDMRQAFVIVMGDSVETIRHGFVRSFGYAIGQVFANIGYDPETNQLFFEKDSDPAFKDKKTKLAREFIKDAESLGYGPRFSQYENLSSGHYELDQFADFVYAESFDSYYCNAVVGDSHNTRLKMKRDFPKTFNAWNKLFNNGRTDPVAAHSQGNSSSAPSGFYLTDENASSDSDIAESVLDSQSRMLGLVEINSDNESDHDTSALSLRGGRGGGSSSRTSNRSSSSGGGFWSGVSSGARYVYNGASSAASAVGSGAQRLAVGTYNVGRSAVTTAGRVASNAGTAVYNGGRYVTQNTAAVASESYRRAVNDYNDTRVAVREGGGGWFANNVSGRLYGAFNAASGAASVVPIAGDIVSAARNGAEAIGGGAMTRNSTTGRLQPVALSDGQRVTRGLTAVWDTAAAVGLDGKLMNGAVSKAGTYAGKAADTLGDMARSGRGGAASFFGGKTAQFAQHSIEAYGNYSQAVTRMTGGENFFGDFTRSVSGAVVGSPAELFTADQVGKFAFDRVNENLVSPGIDRATGGRMIPSP
jgi:hypothetical protein